MQRIAGMWWLPESPSETVPGHLQQEGDQFVLHLVGSLVGPEGRAGVLPVILGRNGDERVSLLDSVWRGSGGSSSGTLTHESWRVFTVLRGAGVDGRETPAFDVASVELDGLAHFMNLRLIEFDRQVPDDDVREVAVVRRPPRIAAITADSEYELFSGWSTHYGMRDLNYQYHASLILRLSALVSLSDVDYRYVRPMRHLLAFASAGDIGTKAMHLGQTDPDDPHSQSPRWELLDVDYDRAGDRREAIPHHMLFTCADWDFASGFPRWKELVDAYGPTCDLLFSRAARDSRYLSTRFLNTVTAAESFHRRSRHDTKASPEHKQRIARLIEAAPEEDRTWLGNKLTWSHEPSLANRLEELVAVATPAAGPYVGSAKPWARAVTDARNALVHRPRKRNDPDVEDPEGLLVLEHSVAAVVTICLLRELGFGPDDCAQRLGRNPSWNWVPKDMQTRHSALFARPLGDGH
jgi:hypothetical protein